MPVPQEIAAILQAGSFSKCYLGFCEITARVLPNRFVNRCWIHFRLRTVNASHAWVLKLKSFTMFQLSVAKAEWRQLKWWPFGGLTLDFLFSWNQEQRQNSVWLLRGELAIAHFKHIFEESHSVIMAVRECSGGYLQLYLPAFSGKRNRGGVGGSGKILDGREGPTRDYIWGKDNIMKEMFSSFFFFLYATKEPQI